MRNLALALLVAAVALGSDSCTDYFRGTTLVFEFDKLPALHRIPELPETLPDGLDATDFKYDSTKNPDGTLKNPEGALCADDAYATAPEHADMLDELDVPYQQPYEYHAWATINGGPVRLARFSTRECTTSNQDLTIKNAITTVSYVRLPEEQNAYPEKPSAWYGIVNAVVSSVPAGGATILTPVRLEQATEIFVTREDAGVSDDSGPLGTLLMQGELATENLVMTATLKKVSGSASGLVTAIPADRVSAW
ncbi:MAG: hypothetical protein HY906_24615 [Deltaproteobacteria bacterium]|nr:hypothetical protein [Deltaproteobacteria bacterium]